MSSIAFKWAKEQIVAREGQDVSPPVKKAVLMLLADYAGVDHFAWPSVSRMAREVECSERTVTRAVNELIKLGYLTKEARWSDNGRQTSNGYILAVGARIAADLVDQGEASPGPQIDQDPIKLRGDSNDIEADRYDREGDSVSPSPLTHCHPPPDKPVTLYNEPLQEQPIEKERAGARELQDGSRDPERGDQADGADHAAAAGDVKSKIGDRWRERIVPALQSRLGPVAVRSWITGDPAKRNGLAVVAHTSDLLILRAPTPFIANWVRSNYIVDLAKAAHCRVEIVEGDWQELLMKYADAIDESWKAINQPKEGPT